MTKKTMLAAFLLLPLARPARAASPSPVLDRLRVGVRDLPAAVAWFDKVLDWKPSYRDDRRASYAPAKLELEAAERDAEAVLVLTSADADADDRRLIERGAEAVSPPADRPSGWREAVVRGPGGLRVELDGPLAAPPDFAFTETSPGRGDPPGPADTVKVRYTGALKDGTVFDGAHRKGRPALVPLASAIRCWTQALGRMKPGGRAHFVCPPSMAYGAQGKPPRVPPNATLVFDVELVDVLR